MPRYDFICEGCGGVAEDVFFPMAALPRHFKHWDCGGARMDFLWRSSYRPAAWSPADRVVLFRNRDGRTLTPGQNTDRTPAGYERVEMSSLADVNRHERASGTVNLGLHFDRNGRDFDFAARSMEPKNAQ